MSGIVGSFLPNIRKVLTDATVQSLAQLKKANGRIPRSTHDNARESLAVIGENISLDALYKRVSRTNQTDAVETPPTDVVEVSQEDSKVSSLSSPDSQDENNAAGVDVSATLSKAGRPTGTTNARKREIAATRKKCLDSITKDYATILAVKKLEGKRITKGLLEELIESKRKEYNISSKIAPGTIRSRLCEGRSHNPKSREATSLLEEAEEALVQICIQMGKIRQPLNVTERVALMNNLIDGTPFQEALAKFQETRKLGNESFEFGRVTKGWWGVLKAKHAQNHDKTGREVCM